MNETRRDFLKKSGGCALGMVALATQMQHLGAISAMAQQAIDSQPLGGENYKAIVLLYFSGGNDANNLVVPIHDDPSVSNYTAYLNARGSQGLALPRTVDQGLGPTLLPITVQRIGNGLTYGLHPALGPGAAGAINNGIHELYGMGKLAIVANVGNLVRPLTKAQYQSSSFQKPYQLFSHSDQVNQSQTSVANTQIFTGWGGRIADKMHDTYNPNRLIPMITSIAGAQLFTAGQSKLPIAIAQANNTGANNITTVLSPAGFGLPTPTGTNLARWNAYKAMVQQDLAGSSKYVSAAANVTDAALDANDALQTAQDVSTAFPNTGIALQLKQVARLIKSRTSLNINRQVFYVQLGGFDTHTNELAQHSTLYGQFSQAMRAFYDEMVAQGVSNDVTTFTLSDFGRTFNPAGTGAGVVGSDHAWGNHALVMGGSVAGGNIYGSLRPDGTGNYFPTLTFAGLDDVDTGSGARGRWLPTTSVDQYAAVMAKWFGLPQDAATLNAVFPNLANFSGAFSQLNFLP